MLTAALGRGTTALFLVAGAGGGAKEIVSASALEPGWSFTAVDPSMPMMELSVARLTEHGLLNRTEVVLGTVDDLPLGERLRGGRALTMFRKQMVPATRRARPSTTGNKGLQVRSGSKSLARRGNCYAC